MVAWLGLCCPCKLDDLINWYVLMTVIHRSYSLLYSIFERISCYMDDIPLSYTLSCVMGSQERFWVTSACLCRVNRQFKLNLFVPLLPQPVCTVTDFIHSKLGMGPDPSATALCIPGMLAVDSKCLSSQGSTKRCARPLLPGHT